MSGTVVIGGGIAGTALVGALAVAGLPARAFEQRRAVGAGAFLFLDGIAHGILADFGIARATLHGNSRPVVELGLSSPERGAVSAPARGHRLWLREDLMSVLTRYAAGAGADIEYESPLLDIAVGPDRDVVGLDVNGRSIEHHGPVVAVDGIDSVVRARLEPDRIPVYAGQVALYGSTTRPVELPTRAQSLHFYSETTSERGYLTDTLGHICYDDVSYWFARITAAEIGREESGPQPIPSWAERILATFPGAQRICAPLLEASEQVHVTNTRNVPLVAARAPMPPVVLAGDANHAVTPAAGVGARMALQDVAEIHRALVNGGSSYEAMASRRAAILAEHVRSGRIYQVEPTHLTRTEA